MSKTGALVRICLAVVCIVAAVLWAIAGLLLLAAALRGQGIFGEHGKIGIIVLVVLWLGGMLGFVGKAVAMARPAVHEVSTAVSGEAKPPKK